MAAVVENLDHNARYQTITWYMPGYISCNTRFHDVDTERELNKYIKERKQDCGAYGIKVFEMGTGHITMYERRGKRWLKL